MDCVHCGCPLPPDRPRVRVCGKCTADRHRRTNRECAVRNRDRYTQRLRERYWQNPEAFRARKNKSYHKNIAKKIVWLAKTRAKKKGLEFDLKSEDIVVPDVCPVFGMTLIGGGGLRDNIPTLDRIDNAKGYVRGNVIVVSWRANRLKCDATSKELRVLADFYGSLS